MVEYTAPKQDKYDVLVIIITALVWHHPKHVLRFRQMKHISSREGVWRRVVTGIVAEVQTDLQLIQTSVPRTLSCSHTKMHKHTTQLCRVRVQSILVVIRCAVPLLLQGDCRIILLLLYYNINTVGDTIALVHY